MREGTQPDPVTECESALKKIKEYNTSRNIWFSKNAVIDRLLSRKLELVEVYRELWAKLNSHPNALYSFFNLALDAELRWNHQKNLKPREARKELVDINQKIAATARDLRDLFERKSKICNTSGFADDSHYSICSVIEAVGENNPLFRSEVMEDFQHLNYQFDLKYWPTFEEFFEEIADNVDKAKVQASNPYTEVATSGIRASYADFLKVLFFAMEENEKKRRGFLPNDFHLSDRSIATLTNRILDIDAEKEMDSTTVKRFRQRERERKQTMSSF